MWAGGGARHKKSRGHTKTEKKRDADKGRAEASQGSGAAASSAAGALYISGRRAARKEEKTGVTVIDKIYKVNKWL